MWCWALLATGAVLFALSVLVERGVAAKGGHPPILPQPSAGRCPLSGAARARPRPGGGRAVPVEPQHAADASGVTARGAVAVLMLGAAALVRTVRDGRA